VRSPSDPCHPAAPASAGEAFRRPSPNRSCTWFAHEVAWWAPFERDAKRCHGYPITTERTLNALTYRTHLEVPGVLAPVAVSVRFEHAPTYNTYGLAPQDYPRVWAERGLPSPHRMPTDDSLCLFFPHDPPERRWHSALGLLTLLDLARDHLFFEHHWRTTGGWSGGEWLGAQAPHGFPGSNTR
jgi:hypothetical protein